MMEGEFEKAENRLESAKNKQKMLADEAEKLSDSLKVRKQSCIKAAELYYVFVNLQKRIQIIYILLRI